MKQLTLTWLGNEIDLKTGRTIFTATFNESVRIEISEKAARTLTSSIYANGAGAAEVHDDYTRPPVQESAAPEDGAEEFGGDVAPELHDTPDSVYDAETGVEQV